jgi:hypothetical protein
MLIYVLYFRPRQSYPYLHRVFFLGGGPVVFPRICFFFFPLRSFIERSIVFAPNISFVTVLLAHLEMRGKGAREQRSIGRLVRLSRYPPRPGLIQRLSDRSIERVESR